MHQKGPFIMRPQPVWQWNEIQQVGTDYSDVSEVERYEKRMGELRDLAAEDAAILTTLELSPGSHVLEIGTGSGHFARAAAAAGHRVTAIDVSPAMLQYAQQRSAAAGLKDIEYQQAGFLTYESQPATFDAVVSVAVLHHLPDLWKAVAMHHIRRLLKPGGQLLLGDVVFSSADLDDPKQFDDFVEALPTCMREAGVGHIAREYSTLDWIMEGILVRAGFRIEKIKNNPASFVQYHCIAC